MKPIKEIQKVKDKKILKNLEKMQMATEKQNICDLFEVCKECPIKKVCFELSLVCAKYKLKELNNETN